MQTFGSFLVSLVAASSLAAAAPAASNDGTFAVPAQYNANARLSGPAALAKIYTKYGKSLPQDLSQALLFEQHKVTSSAGAHPQDNDQYYTTPVEFGTPAQTIYMDLDTGSSDLWVFSNDTYADQVNGQKLYLPGHSSTAKRLPKLTWDAQYGDGSTSSGIVYSDVVSIGGAKVQNQAVESARNVSEQFATDARMSGVLGLAFGNLNTVKPTKQKTFFDNIMPSLKEPLFTVNLKHKADGTYKFGYIDPADHNGPIAYSPVNTTGGYWTWTSTGYAVGSKPFHKTPIINIADTGSSLMTVPGKIASAYYDTIPGARYEFLQGGFIFPCDAKLPDFTFGIDDKTRITIPGSLLNYAPAEGKDCYGGIQSSAFAGINIFGDVALKAALVVFDGGKTRIGWAPKQL
ncbi:hypothetical protein E4U43_003538 [Claviceps pusilla]|uniref:Peptidase A1 domain-containing protein n=1 Tax=Claviceps pusilla TaxID=123648 RepID=A0A9P7N6Q0_9HYPO|nr:hypothetical protein E4U43_003538 [Claviceps pusilla]